MFDNIGNRTRIVAGSAAALIAVPLAVAVVWSTPAGAAPSRQPKVEAAQPAPFTNVPLGQTTAAPATGTGPMTATSWPTAGSADISLPAVSANQHAESKDKAGGVPVSVARTATATDDSASAVRVDVASQSAAERAGVRGVLLSVTPTVRDRGGLGRHRLLVVPQRRGSGLR